MKKRKTSGKSEAPLAVAPGSAYILRENLMRALHVAIESNRANANGHTGETLGWQQVLNELQNGRPINVQ